MGEERHIDDEGNLHFSMTTAKATWGRTFAKENEAQTFCVRLQKPPGEKLGFQFGWSKSPMQVVVIHENSPLHAHNQKAEASKQVRQGDTIVAVNGVSGNKKQMRDVFSQAEEIQMIVRRTQRHD